MRKISFVLWFALLILTMVAFVGCDDDPSSSNPSSEDIPIESSSDNSSSSLNENMEISSTEQKSSSSSSCKTQSSSSEKGVSSTAEESSSSHVDEASSSSDYNEVASSDVSSSSVLYSSAVEVVDADGVIKGTVKDERDGRVYKIVKIGDMVWMAENLNYAYLAKTKMLDSSSVCFDNLSSNCEKYGRLYLWSAAMDSSAVFTSRGKGCGYKKICRPDGTIRGVCPEGWHLPSHYEFEKLINHIDPSFGYFHTGDAKSLTAGVSLKSRSEWYNDGNGTDEYGFTALPTGSASNWSSIIFSEEVDFAGFWSSGEYNSVYGYDLFLKEEFDYAMLSGDNKYDFKSIRCVMDYENDKFSSDGFPSVPVVDPSTVVKGTLTDSRDNHVYKTVTIGSQTWMAENLDYEMENSSCYGEVASNCEKFGGLYNWPVAIDSVSLFSSDAVSCGFGKFCNSLGSIRGICPEGWHLPSDMEWKTLFAAVGDTSVTGTKLKSTTGWADEKNGTDDYGFAVLPGGCRESNKVFAKKGSDAYFWRTSDFNGANAYYWNISSTDGQKSSSYDHKYSKFSVRCLKD